MSLAGTGGAVVGGAAGIATAAGGTTVAGLVATGLVCSGVGAVIGLGLAASILYFSYKNARSNQE